MFKISWFKMPVLMAVIAKFVELRQFFSSGSRSIASESLIGENSVAEVPVKKYSLTSLLSSHKQDPSC